MNQFISYAVQTASSLEAHFSFYTTQTLAALIDNADKLNFYILAPVGLAVVALLIGYLRNYQWPAERLCHSLGKLIALIRDARFKRKDSPDQLKGDLDGLFAVSPFRALWEEYCSSLHTVRSGGEGVQKEATLATLPAEMFFAKESMIDLRINADFYRHLPGMLTGIGIIGTFSGLVWGLHEFRPDPSESLSSLPRLLQEVTSAFVGSGFAILAAIFVTYKEKSILNRCYRLVDELNREIDGIYETGAGEAYLARLVSASEAQERQGRELSAAIGASIREALAEPMRELSGAVRDISKSQHAAVGELLDTVLQAFLPRLEGVLGQRLETVSRSFERSAAALEEAQRELTRLAGELTGAGAEAVGRMSDRLDDALSGTAQAQELMRQQMLDFAGELRDALSQQQRQSSEVMDVAMRSVLSKLQAALGQIAADRHLQIEMDQDRHRAMTVATQRLYDSLSAHVAAIQGTAGGAISGMQDGAAAQVRKAG